MNKDNSLHKIKLLNRTKFSGHDIGLISLYIYIYLYCLL